MGPTSKHLEMYDINNKYRFKDDGFDIGNVNKNPIIVAPDVFTRTDFSKSNKVVAFEVSFGDQNQSIFKDIELDQSSIRNTSESFEVLERLGKSETGASTAQVDIGLWDIYRQSSYQCQVTCMGNMMIQPTMYFYLKNVPLFKGSYWITEVTHDIRTNKVETKFKGTRIPSQSLPDPKDSFLASYRSLFDKLLKRAAAKVKEESEAEAAKGKEKTIVTSDGKASTYDASDKPMSNEEKIIPGAGITSYGIPYNGYNDEKYITMVEYRGQRWLKTKVVQLQGNNYKVPMDRDMTLLCKVSDSRKVTWRDVFGTLFHKGGKYYFSKFDLKSTTSDNILDNYSQTLFINANPNIKNKYVVPVTTNIDYTRDEYEGPISVGPNLSGYGLALSAELMFALKVYDGDYVYFKMV